MKYKLVCFDLDGTIIDETISIWQTLHKELRMDIVKLDHVKRKFYNGEITYHQWTKHDVGLWKKHNVTKQQMLDIIGKLRLMKGAKETLKELKKKGLKLAVISGSLNFAIEHLLPDYKKYFDDVLINEVFFDEKGLIKSYNFTKYDEGKKSAGLKMIAKREKITLSECVFVGDHNNDVDAAKEAGLGISFNSKSENLDKVADVVIRNKDLREILKYIN